MHKITFWNVFLTLDNLNYYQIHDTRTVLQYPLYTESE